MDSSLVATRLHQCHWHAIAVIPCANASGFASASSHKRYSHLLQGGMSLHLTKQQSFAQIKQQSDSDMLPINFCPDPKPDGVVPSHGNIACGKILRHGHWRNFGVTWMQGWVLTKCLQLWCRSAELERSTWETANGYHQALFQQHSRIHSDLNRISLKLIYSNLNKSLSTCFTI